jgi:hypothetical protein
MLSCCFGTNFGTVPTKGSQLKKRIPLLQRDFLMEMKIVNETQADLGLTAIPSSSVLDIMCQVRVSISGFGSGY